MKLLDRIIQKSRIKHALAFLPQKVRLIDVGSHKGEIFTVLGDLLVEGFGIEPLIQSRVVGDRYVIYPGYFPESAPKTLEWDAITMLAVLEHVPESQQIGLASACHRLLKKGGLVIITVPSPIVDYILAVLSAMRLIHGMSLEEHYGFKPTDTVKIFSEPHFRLKTHRKFQFGLNNLYVFEKK